MFLGPFGSKISGLLDGLLNQPLHQPESIAPKDTLNIKCHWVEAADTAENAWKAMEDEDEVQKLASLCHLAIKSKSGWPQIVATNITGTSISVQKAAEDVTNDVVQRALQLKVKHTPSSKDPDIMMHIWDCGGQAVLLDILSVFLSSHTMFLLLFNASLPFDRKCQQSQEHEGFTNKRDLQLMKWIRLIHANLMAKNEMSSVAEVATYKEAATHRKSVSLPVRPKIIIVCTYDDTGSSIQAQQRMEELESSCEGTALQGLIIDRLIIKKEAGEGENDHHKKIRKAIHKEITRSPITPTPLPWIAFRKVVQKVAAGSPVLSYEQVNDIAQTCGVAQCEVPSLLNFYHQLGVFLHYKNIKSLSTTIISKPQWLVEQLCKLLMLESNCSKHSELTTQWKWLTEKGILLQTLCENVWQDCGWKDGTQALADLLEHFNLAKKINICSLPKDVQWYEKYAYFIPCVLKAELQEGPFQEKMETSQKAFKKAATLHIVFNTGCIPPGFFVSLAALMIVSDKYTPKFERCNYRNSITFIYEKIDRITITESKSLVSIQVDMIRVVERPYQGIRFAESCVAFQEDLCTMCKNIQHDMPSIELYLAFRCSCEGASKHFVIIDNEGNRNSPMFCEKYEQYKMNPEHKYWFRPEQSQYQVISLIFI